MTAGARTTGLVYDDLASFPDDNLRRELIGGELIVTPVPWVRHQEVVTELLFVLGTYAKQHGGQALVAPLDVVFSDSDVVEPDVMYISQHHLGRLEEWFLRGAPDIAVEVSSPSQRRLELVRKRDLYERHGVPEYWYVDVEIDRIEVFRLGEHGGYPPPTLLGRGDRVTSPVVPGLELPLDDILGPPE